MKLAIMQPYFFPYLGYYSLIRSTDKLILFDTAQFIKHGWIHRNRILRPSLDSCQYIRVPLKKHSVTTPINNVLIYHDEDWRGRLVRQLDHYRKIAPFYESVLPLVEGALNIDTDSIVKLNTNILIKTCEYLKLPLNLEILSDMHLEIDKVTYPGQWPLNISKALGAKQYVNPIGGASLFRPYEFEEAGVSLKFVSNNLSEYKQGGLGFMPGLSIIDVMMFNDVETINQLIDDASLSDSDLSVS
jgi:hypothetical protein